jgi:hypothetical protein
MSLVLARMNDTQKRDMVLAALDLVEALEDVKRHGTIEGRGNRVAEHEIRLCRMVIKLKKEFQIEDPPANS